jgi:hypothetical protein
MIPVRLTASPINTITSRPLALEVIPRLRKLMRKPRKVTRIPSKTIFVSPFIPLLFLFVLPRLALHEQHERNAQSQDSEDDPQPAHIRR